MTTTIIEASGLVKYYGSFAALDHVSFQVAEGAMTGLLGPNGAGKTTLLKTLLGFLPSSSGSCRVLGHSPSASPLQLRRVVGFMPENEAWFPDLTGLEAVVYAGRLSGMPREAAFSRAHEVLDFLGMDEVRHRPVAGYSVGLKQKVKLGQAVVHGPRLCFLDEPLSGLDPRSRQEMMSLLAGVGRSGVSMIISSHVLRDVETLCSSVLMLNRGKLLFSGPLADLRRRTEGQFLVQLRGDVPAFLAQIRAAGIAAKEGRGVVQLQLPPASPVAPIWRAARDSGCQIRELRPASDSLEQAFLRLLGREG